VWKILGIKEKILELLVENDGLSFIGILDKYKEKYDVNLNESSGYKFLQRLRDNNMIITENHYYKPTAKGKNYQTDDLEFLKNLFEREAVEIRGSKLTKEDFERLDVI